MRKILAILTVATCISCNDEKTETETTLNETQAVEEVEALVQNVFDDIWSAMDTTAITRYQTDDFLLLEHGEVWDNRVIKEWAVNAKARRGNTQRINSFERIRYKLNGHKLWLAYHNYATIRQDTLERKLSWLESVVAVKQDSIWKLELMHSTRNTPRE